MCPECLLAGRSLANSSKPARVLAQMRNAIRNSPLQSVLLAVALVFVAMLWLASDGKKAGNTTSRPNAAHEGGVPPLATPPIAPEINHVPPVSEREHAKDIPPATTGLSAKEVFKRVALAVVSIETQSAKGEPLSRGTGFFVDDRGTFITNAHVIAVSTAVNGNYLQNGQTGWIMRNSTWGAMRTLDLTNYNRITAIEAGIRYAEGWRVALSESASAIGATGVKPLYFGNFNYYAFCERTSGVQIDRWRDVRKGITYIVASWRYGGDVTQPEAFAIGVNT